jgi:hypothetical protein
LIGWEGENKRFHDFVGEVDVGEDGVRVVTVELEISEVRPSTKDLLERVLVMLPGVFGFVGLRLLFRRKLRSSTKYADAL